jgi:hypothetical protein
MNPLLEHVSSLEPIRKKVEVVDGQFHLTDSQFPDSNVRVEDDVRE